MVLPKTWRFKWVYIENHPYSKFLNQRQKFVGGHGGVYTFKIGIALF
jgi:hypothetical protein